jgi:hypothetical protein
MARKAKQRAKLKAKRKAVVDQGPDIHWREFEKLIARIEKAAAPLGAMVTWNDSIADLETGEPRQVDVSIRYRNNTVDQLVTVECRKREQKSDARWIEELDGKKRSVGADLTIAVSHKRLTEPAIIKAGLRGILVRQAALVSEKDIQGWLLLPKALVLQITGWALIGVQYMCVSASDAQHELDPSVRDAFALQKGEACIFHRWQGGNPISIDQMLQAAFDKNRNLFEDIPFDSSSVEGFLRLLFPPDNFGIQTIEGLIPLAGVRLKLRLANSLQKAGVTRAVHYTGPDSTDIRRLEFDFEVALEAERRGYQLGVQTEGESRTLLISLEKRDLDVQ